MRPRERPTGTLRHAKHIQRATELIFKPAQQRQRQRAQTLASRVKIKPVNTEGGNHRMQDSVITAVAPSISISARP